MQSEIAVIGNGPVGKAAALAFAQAGFKVTLLAPKAASASTSEDWDSRVYALNHIAKKLLSNLKVWDALNLQRIAPVEAMHVFDDSGAALTLDAWSANQQELAWIVEDQNLNQALDTALRFTPNVQIVIGTAQSAAADFSSLILDNQNTMQADLWIAADGAQSWMRNQAEIGLDYRSYAQRGVVANFSCAKPHHGVAYQWFVGELGVIALLPLPGQQVSLVWSAPDSLAATLITESTDQLATRLAEYCSEQLGDLASLSPHRALSFPLQYISPHSMIGPRFALVGDAAHVVHPLAGHGMNLGFADVVALLDAVTAREVWRSCGDERVLQRYARARKEDVMLMQFATDGLSRLFGSPLTPIKSIRNLGLNLVNKLPLIKKQLMRQAMGL
jgi:ubiquinone biosynthesis UbiH/UbiF/VisC/COQ6 family hydroxylase